MAGPIESEPNHFFLESIQYLESKISTGLHIHGDTNYKNERVHSYIESQSIERLTDHELDEKYETSILKHSDGKKEHSEHSKIDTQDKKTNQKHLQRIHKSKQRNTNPYKEQSKIKREKQDLKQTECSNFAHFQNDLVSQYDMTHNKVAIMRENVNDSSERGSLKKDPLKLQEELQLRKPCAESHTATGPESSSRLANMPQKYNSECTCGKSTVDEKDPAIDKKDKTSMFPPQYIITEKSTPAVSMAPQTWDIMLNNFRIAMESNNFFVCDNFMGKGLAEKISAELLHLNSRGYFRVSRDREHGCGRSLFVEKPNSKHKHIDCLLFLVRKLVHCYICDWQYFTVELSYCKIGETPQEIFDFDESSTKSALKCLYFPTIQNKTKPPKMIIKSSAGSFEVDFEMDRFVAFWGDALEHDMIAGVSEMFVIVMWLFR